MHKSIKWKTLKCGSMTYVLGAKEQYLLTKMFSGAGAAKKEYQTLKRSKRRSLLMLLTYSGNKSKSLQHNFRFRITILASDETGEFEILLEDREVRALLGKRAHQVFDEVLQSARPNIYQTYVLAITKNAT